MAVSDAPSRKRAGNPVDHSPVGNWLTLLDRRHLADLTSSEYLKAVRALSARYVERRGTLPQRSTFDSEGKRAAFAAYYAPLHFLTTTEVLGALDAGRLPLRRLVDLGCGTGAASAAWAVASSRRPTLLGIDASGWAVNEARWNWRALGLSGHLRRTDFVAALEARASVTSATTGLVFGWSLNELTTPARARVLAALCADLQPAVLILEPLARSVTPWWPEWASAFAAVGGREDEWHFHVDLPATLARTDRAAGFRREELTARTLWRPPLRHARAEHARL